jgi:hypothetical protein
MSTPEVPKEIPEIPEKDKPFYLAIISALLVATDIIIGGLGAYHGDVAVVNYAQNVFTPLFGLMSVSWAWYFKEKSS